MKKVLTVALLLATFTASAQKYEANWESLDARPTPQWFKDAKFGIFIHWGVYAVPGWSTKGNYAEWYQQGLQTTDTARQRFHKAKFGDKTYYQLADDFKAELFNPDEWAKLFERSGAKYIVLTSKHHDGYTLWPSKDADRTWGFPWNAVAVGPKRDLLGDLFTAVRKTSVHAGMYYSLYEWFNPLWKKDPAAFAQQHTWPQMKDLINTYQPDVFWTDGDWDASAETWKSQEFLSWLYNESPVKEKIVVNDRWGSGIRFKHAGIYTPEYQPDLDFEDHYWEESRGMGYSYGYNREEDAWDYNSTQSLVIALIDKVSRGGNFLLDIGPDEHGKIPPIMQERLLQMGEWMKVNGEAIYGTSRWKTPVQWSEGKRDYKFKNEHNTEDWKTGGDVMLKLTVDPDPGYAVKELFFTYNATSNSLYGLFPSYPKNNQLILRNTTLPAGSVISFLSTKEPCSWKQQGNDVVVQLPAFNAEIAKVPYTYAIKISNYGRFAAKPKVNVNFKPGALQPDVTIQAEDGDMVHYTIDGTEPTISSPVYSAPFVMKTSTPVKAIVEKAGALNSAVVEVPVKTYEWKKAVSGGSAAGLNYAYFEGKPASVNELPNMQAKTSGIASTIDLSKQERKEYFGLVFSGYITVPTAAIYEFYIASDDGSSVWIDGEEVVNHDGFHGNDEKKGSIALKKGAHRIEVRYFQGTGGQDLWLKYSSSIIKKQVVPTTAFTH